MSGSNSYTGAIPTEGGSLTPDHNKNQGVDALANVMRHLTGVGSESSNSVPSQTTETESVLSPAAIEQANRLHDFQRAPEKPIFNANFEEDQRGIAQAKKYFAEQKRNKDQAQEYKVAVSNEIAQIQVQNPGHAQEAEKSIFANIADYGLYFNAVYAHLLKDTRELRQRLEDFVAVSAGNSLPWGKHLRSRMERSNTAQARVKGDEIKATVGS